MFRFSKGLVSAVLLAFGFLSSTSSVNAGFTATFDGVSPGISPAGQYNWHTSAHIAGIVYNSPSSNSFVTFCIQVSQYVAPGSSYYYSVVQLDQAPDGAHMSVAQANQIRRLWTAERSDINAAGNETVPVGMLSVSHAYTADQKSAAFQWTIWEILGQNTYSGDTWMRRLIDLYKSESNNTSYALANLAAMTNGTSQDQIFELATGYTTDNETIVPTPVPPAAIMALTGIIPCLALRRRFVGRG